MRCGKPLSQNRDQPIQIEAASLEMRDKKREATFANEGGRRHPTATAKKNHSGVLRS
jgi:hypothetical protein